MIKWFKKKYADWKFAREKSKFKNSTEPWVVIRGESIDPVKGLRLDMDWNEAFVRHLRTNGVKGTKDDDVVACWVTMLHSQLIGGADMGEDE